MTEPLGLLAFRAIKAIGYTVFAVYLNKAFPDKPRNIFAVGIARTLLGLVLGTLLAMLSFPFVLFFGIGGLVYVGGLILVRILEWWIILRSFYSGDPPFSWSDAKTPITYGVITSFLLDIPALSGLVYATHFWIC